MQTNSIWVKSKREIAGIFKTEIVQKADPTFMKILDLFFFSWSVKLGIFENFFLNTVEIIYEWWNGYSTGIFFTFVFFI